MNAAPLAGVELGGTKCVCILGTGPADVRETVRVTTTGPEQTLGEIAAVLARWRAAHGAPPALGIASFGPLDLRPGSPRYGRITAGAKPGWSGADVAGCLGAAAGAPVALDTDVNGAALAEGRWGAARDVRDFAYVTVGTGVGVGLVVAGHTVHGCHHPELGHLRIARAKGDDWPGTCALHGDCVEGLASGPALAARAGRPAAEIGADDPVWGLAAHALAQLLHAIVLATAPARIVVGGGVAAARPALLGEVRRRLKASLNGYLDVPELAGELEAFVVPPGLGALAGPLGALALARAYSMSG